MIQECTRCKESSITRIRIVKLCDDCICDLNESDPDDEPREPSVRRGAVSVQGVRVTWRKDIIKSLKA